MLDCHIGCGRHPSHDDCDSDHAMQRSIPSHPATGVATVITAAVANAVLREVFMLFLLILGLIARRLQC